MAANVAPVSYALVAKKAAGTSEENDSTNPMSEVPQNPESQAGNPVSKMSDRKKRTKRNRNTAKKAVSKLLFFLSKILNDRLCFFNVKFVMRKGKQVF